VAHVRLDLQERCLRRVPIGVSYVEVKEVKEVKGRGEGLIFL
jgi:hypothetical protein